MGLNNIHLNATLLQDFYNKSLVDLNISETDNRTEKNENRAFLGNNQSKICVLVNEDAAPFITDENLELLTNILTACKLSLNDIVLFNMYPKPGLMYPEICTGFSPEKWILFGVNPSSAGIPMEFPEYKLQGYNHQTFLRAPGLPVIKNNKEEKGKLWACLKNLFNS